MPLVTADALVLQAFAYGETSKILRLLTRTHGVQSVIAKGALRPRSRFGGILEPFTEGTASFYLKDSRELQTLSGFELQRSQQALGRDLLRFGGASLIAEIVIRTASEEPAPELFEAVREALHRIREAEPDVLESVLLAQAWFVVSLLGFAPVLDECVSCGRDLGVDESASFDYGAGGVRCTECARVVQGHTVPPAARAALRSLVQGAAVPLPRTDGHWKLLSRYLDHHVLEGGSLRSLGFLAETLEARDRES
ncbi:MAG TPA: DNA repair protein RecO [Longimicrobiales bacterium]|nr:DNA repair protein RecO [Longimicrobiales bacterium]